MSVDGGDAADTSGLDTGLASPHVDQDAWAASLSRSQQVRFERAMGLSTSPSLHHV